MKRFWSSLLMVALLVLVACAPPLPAERQNYVGHWQGPGVDMLILADGSFTYKRIKGSASTSIEAPIQKFEGDDFFVGVGPISTRFDVSRPPREIDGQWQMTVDGVELIRTGTSVDAKPMSNEKLLST